MIRVATMDDRERILDMAIRFLTLTSYGKIVTPNRQQLGVIVAKTIEELGVILLGEVDGQVVGMLAIVALTHPFSGEVYGDELVWWVEPEHRRSRVGPQLLAAGEEWAYNRRLNVLKMVAPAGSTIGTYYERRGFILVESVYQKTLTE